jgi:hypothetical protein
MKIKESAHGKAIVGENSLPRKYIIGMERVPKIRGMIRRSLSGLVKGWNRLVRT